MQTIYIIVGKKIRQAEARIVGKIAEVQTPYGSREFGVWYLDIPSAMAAINERVINAARRKTDDGGTGTQ